MLSISKKSARFKRLLPKIEAYLAEGYKYAEVIAILKFEHDLDMTVNLFATYLHRYRTKAVMKPNQIEEIIINPSSPVSPPPPVAQVKEHTEQDSLKKARELLAQERQKLDLTDLLGA